MCTVNDGTYIFFQSVRFMNKEFFERKVRELSDDKLQDLLKLQYDARNN